MTNNKGSILGIASIAIPSVLSLFILNFFLGIIPMEKIQGLPVIMPMFFCPIGAIIGLIGYWYRTDRLSIIGIFFNILLFLFPFVYHILGTLLFGV